MFGFSFLQDIGTYEQRKVGLVEPEDNGGLGVSTAWTSDEGYETALLDANGTHPVERYPEKEAAQKGHRKWVARAKEMEDGATVRELSWEDTPEMDEDIQVRKVA